MPSTKNQGASIKWVEFTGSAACQDLVAAKAVVFPAIPEATDKAVAAFKAKGVDMTPFTDLVKNKEIFLFPITDHASDITAIMNPAMQSFLSFKSRRQLVHRGQHAGQPVVPIGEFTSGGSRKDSPDSEF